MSDKEPPSEVDLADISTASEPSTDSVSSQARREERQFALAQQRLKGEEERKSKDQSIGKIGKLVGDRDHAPIYGTGATIILTVLALIAFGLLDSGLRSQAFDVLGKIALTAVGFLGGLLTRATK